MEPNAQPTPPAGFFPDIQAAAPQSAPTPPAGFEPDKDNLDNWTAQQTELSPSEEQKFRNWLKANPKLPQPDNYDLKGFYSALKRGDPRAKVTVDANKQMQLPNAWQLSPGMSKREMENAGSGAILDFGGHGQDTAREILRPILGEAGAEEGANAIANLYKAMPYLGMLAGLKGPKAEAVPEVAGVPYEPPAPSIQPPREPIAPPVAPAPAYAGENPPPVQPTYPPDRPTTAVPVARVETPVAPAAPETPYAPRPETPIAPARPETSFAADAVAAQPPPEPLIPAQIAPIAASAAPEAPPIASAAPEPPESPQTPVIGPPEAPPAPVGRSAIGRTPATPPGPAIETIGDIPIEQGDRDFAALLKTGAEKDADLAKFISKPKKAEPIIMQARRLYLASNGDINPIDLGKRLGIPKRTAQAMVKGLDSLAAEDKKKLTLTAPVEAEAPPPATEEPAEPSQAELEAAGQTSMFGPAPAPRPAAPEPAAPPPGFAPAPVPQSGHQYTPEQFAGIQPMPFSRTNVFDVPTHKIRVAPEHFQYKLGSNEQGAGLSLTQAKGYDPDYAGNLTLWHDAKGEIGPAGEFYVVNGHQRLALAVRDGAPSVRAQVYDSGTDLEGAARHSVTKEAARARGALINFSEGRGTSIDAATYVRNAGLKAEDLADLNLDLTERRVDEAMQLAKLSNPIWHEVAIGRLKPDLGAVIGRELGDNEPLQIGVLKMLNQMREKGESVSEQRLEDLITAQKVSGVYSETQTDLFGQREMRKSMAEEFADLWSQARAKYGEGRLHTGIVKHQQELEQGDTKIDVETAKKIAARKQELATTFKNLHKIGGTKTVAVTREYAQKLAAEPKMKNKIYAQYLKELEPALDEDAVNLRLKPGEMTIEHPQAELPVK